MTLFEWKTFILGKSMKECKIKRILDSAESLTNRETCFKLRPHSAAC